MKRYWAAGLTLVAVALFVLTAASQPREDREKRDRPPRGEDGKDKKDGPPRGRPGPPPRFELGRVLPHFLRDELELTLEQDEEILKLEKEVRERLSKILTGDQKRRLENIRPPRPPRPPRDGDFDRPRKGKGKGDDDFDRPPRRKGKDDDGPPEGKGKDKGRPRPPEDKDEGG